MIWIEKSLFLVKINSNTDWNTYCADDYCYNWCEYSTTSAIGNKLIGLRHIRWKQINEYIILFSFFRCDEMIWFWTQRIGQILCTKCLLNITFCAWRIQRVNNWLNVRLSPHLTQMPAKKNKHTYMWNSITIYHSNFQIEDMDWDGCLHIEIIFIYKNRTDSSYDSDYVTEQ